MTNIFIGVQSFVGIGILVAFWQSLLDELEVKGTNQGKVLHLEVTPIHV